MNEIDTIIQLIPIIITALSVIGALSYGLKKVLNDIVKALEDGIITIDEAIVILKSSINVFNIFKRIFKK